MAMFQLHPILFLYNLLQWFLDKLLSPAPPPPHAHLRRPRIAIIGAGLTGVASASHCVGHGFDVTIFEADGRERLGGIWSRVNKTSGLQIHSVMYRFHPSVKWDSGYPSSHQIVNQITKLWERYGLEDKTQFNTRVTKVYSDGKKGWFINDPSYGSFDGVMAAVGSCGLAKMPPLEGQEKFAGEVFHSSDLDDKEAKGKNVIIIGGGASAVEALEWASKTGAAQINVLSRSDKWIIPRNAFVDVLLAFNVFGQETMFSWIPESFLRIFFYRDLKDLSPSSKGLFTDTPMVNSEIFDLIRAGKAHWLRGDILHVEENGIMFNHRTQGVPKGGPGHEGLVEGAMIVMATGFKKPSLRFLPDEAFQAPYQPPNWYIQVTNFVQVMLAASLINETPNARDTSHSFYAVMVQDLLANSTLGTYVNAIGTVGNYHIGIYTRLLIMFLVDPLTRPKEYWMKRWIDMTTFFKSRAPTGAFDFFTYAELIWWFAFVVTINPFRWKWALFVFFGLGQGLPLRVVQDEDILRKGLGYGKRFED